MSPIAQNPLQEKNNIFNKLSDILNNSDEDTLAKPNQTNISLLAQQKSACLKTQPTLDYRKINQGQVAKVKFHP